MTTSSTLGKALLFLAVIGLAGCKKENEQQLRFTLASGYSISVNNGNVLVNGFKNDNNTFSTKYWVNAKVSSPSGFTALVKNQTGYRQSVDDQFRAVYSYKDLNGQLQNYQFDQGSLAKGGKMFYYKNDALVNMDTDSIGTISCVAFYNGQSYFAGALGKITSSEAGNYLRPLTPFVWDGHSSMILLPLPKQTFNFQGVSSIYIPGPNEIYVGGRCSVPMYWKNTEPVVLDERYGEVWQITKSGSDVYAVGLINKRNSNSTGHTACYWKNGKLQELEDLAQAYGIFINGEDVYVTGSVGNVPIDYKPCYWKNGVRVDLPM
ncbi:hypothetical protein [Pedobacter sp. GR22-6]|uniref:hypothetical protein n=1 Tax=Pedobacter sp. GR22-6 TaxID=3127957 RepID=UPI00307F6796